MPSSQISMSLVTAHAHTLLEKFSGFTQFHELGQPAGNKQVRVHTPRPGATVAHRPLSQSSVFAQASPSLRLPSSGPPSSSLLSPALQPAPAPTENANTANTAKSGRHLESMRKPFNSKNRTYDAQGSIHPQLKADCIYFPTAP
jgi:hypothetical protein